VQDFRKLLVWKKSHALTLETYRISRDFPREEMFGLTSQMRRCATSMPSNIAEGCGRGSDPDFARFLIMAMGSSSELEYQLLLSKDLGYVDTMLHQQTEDKVIEVKRMLASLIQKVQGKWKLIAES
jgi:four helix bundle protein